MMPQRRHGRWVSGGSVEVVVHYGGALGYKSADHFDAVGEGALEISDTYGGAFGGLDPLFLVSSLPFFVTTVEEAALLYQVAEPEFKRVFEENNQILLYASPWPPCGIWASDEITSSAALEGLTIRTYDKNGTTALNEMGAAAVRLSWAAFGKIRHCLGIAQCLRCGRSDPCRLRRQRPLFKCFTQHQGRKADLRCRRELKRALQRKRTLMAVIQFSVCKHG
ncbi:MAG: hypothetical protein ABJ246_00735 [Paracoccaceae bacterium]